MPGRHLPLGRLVHALPVSSAAPSMVLPLQQAAHLPWQLRWQVLLHLELAAARELLLLSQPEGLRPVAGLSLEHPIREVGPALAAAATMRCEG